MIQFNLLPDVKMQYLKANRRKQTVMTVSIVASIAAFAIFILLILFVWIAQKQNMKNLDNDIQTSVQVLKEKPDLDKVLTIQNQLNSLPALHDQKAISSRLFDYLVQLTPNDVTISDVVLDFETSTINIKGNANALSTINKFADTLKFTDYRVNGEVPSEGKAFSNVVLQSFSVSEGAQGVGYELNVTFAPAIFANVKGQGDTDSLVKLTIPNVISTRSQTEAPNELFVPQPNGGGQ